MPVSLVLPRPPMVPSDGVTPMPLGVEVPLTLVPMRAELEREVLRAPVRRVLLVPPVVARAPVRPELLRVLALRRAAELRVPDDRRVVLRPAGFRAVLRLAGFRVVLRLAGLRPAGLRVAGLRVVVLRLAGFRVVLRLAGFRVAGLRVVVLRLAGFRVAGFRVVLRLAGLRVVVLRRAAGLRVVVLRLAGFRVVLRLAGLRAAVLRLAGLRAVALPPRVPSVFAAALTRLDAGLRVVLREAGLRVVLREAGLRVVLREAGLRVVLRDAGLRVVLRPDVDRDVVPPLERLLVPVDLLRAVAICSLLVGDVEGNADVWSMRIASADIQQERHLSYFEMSSTRSPVCASDASRAMSA